MASPMMQQFQAAKREHPDGILFFRMGDFYEMFYADAEQASELLGLTLTARSKGDSAVPMAGVPVRNVDTYVNRLVALGRKVVICDQVQDASEAKGLVERAVTRVVTPGTVLEEDGLEEKSDNFLCGLVISDGTVGLACADISTGIFQVEEVEIEGGLDALLRREPAELLLPERALEADSPYVKMISGLELPRATLPDWRFDREEAERLLKEHFGVARLDGFGVADLGPAIAAAGAVLHYLLDTQRGAVDHIRTLRRVTREDMVLDRTTRASLELTRTLRDGGRKGSLVWVLDKTLTPMGARLLKRWLVQPLVDAAAIEHRQGGVGELVEEGEFRDRLRGALKKVQDVDRLLSRVSCGRATARELVGLRQSLSVLPSLATEIGDAWSGILRECAEELPDLSSLHDLLARALRDEVPVTIKEGGMIREGFDPELDELHQIGSENKTWIASFQAREQDRTGIPSLKVGFNKVFGYYLEVTHAHAGRVPADYIRKQTLKNAERYITPELKEYEEKALGAEEKIKEREYEHFLRLREAVQEELPAIQKASDVIAVMDVLQSLAQAAEDHGYVRPTVEESRDIEIEEGRHPVLDRMLEDGPFVPNDLRLAAGTRELILLTGPNMAGKSTWIRQAALLVLMAQIGSFVPARAARVGVVDRIFTRVGASDELQRGNSTFMVEMIETAEILNNATDRSLVILDEVGRGTSTFDGLSIAWAITEYLAEKVHSRTLFATHYHHLLDLADRLPNAANMSVAVREWGDEIVFLHKIVEGGTDRSYGIHVARLAGLPLAAIARAEAVLQEVETDSAANLVESDASERQLSLFSEPADPIRVALRETDLDATTPLEALILLTRLKEQARSLGDG